MPENLNYALILSESEKYLSDIEKNIEIRNQKKHALKQIQDSLFDAVGDIDNAQIKQRRYNYLNSLLDIIDDPDKKEILQKFLNEIFQMTKESYDPERHFENVRSYIKIGELFDEDLISALVSKLGNHVQKEVKYLQMKEPEYLDNEVCDMAIGSIQNITSMREEPTQQQTYEIVLLYEIFNFRLSTLDDEQAWDFMAQSILEESKTKEL